MRGATTYYAYDGEKPIWEGGATQASNIYGIGIDEIAIRFKPNTTHFFYQDGHGSVSFVTNLSSIIEKYRYDAFGTPTIRNGSGTIVTESGISNRFMFTGREWEPQNLRFYEYRARAYHPAIGRFMSEDPKLFGGGDNNFFRYCNNDPANNVDPMGLQGGPRSYNESAGQGKGVLPEPVYGEREVMESFKKTGTVVLPPRTGSHIPVRVDFEMTRTNHNPENAMRTNEKTLAKATHSWL